MLDAGLRVPAAQRRPWDENGQPGAQRPQGHLGTQNSGLEQKVHTDAVAMDVGPVYPPGEACIVLQEWASWWGEAGKR